MDDRDARLIPLLEQMRDLLAEDVRLRQVGMEEQRVFQAKAQASIDAAPRINGEKLLAWQADQYKNFTIRRGVIRSGVVLAESRPACGAGRRKAAWPPSPRRACARG